MEEAGDKYEFFRENANAPLEAPPTRLTYKEARRLLFASHKNPDAAMKKLVEGHRVRTRFGTYYAKKKI